ncbi:MFS transporter [Moraxella sp. ZY210820]|uniref:MFS transporter n=1 Tax=unclassified Moraxella TaxID=2685852 RepID=UPI00272FB060|nr:MFS transporter [Moraxella sp. ZY210820]WLF84088.1 MFS transporter [Moraxella sp. ZY210820]
MNSLERRATFALSSIFALRMLGLFMIIPVFAVAGRDYVYATPALIGLAVGVYGLSQAIFQIPFSMVADRFSRKPLIILGLALFALGGAIAAMSESIYGVIIGRAVAGAGAVSAVVMALLADVTREEQRSKAMAIMGMSIGLSFVIAFAMSPWITSQIGISGLFWLTCVMGILAIFVLALVPNIQRFHQMKKQNFTQQLKQVLSMRDVNRLHISIFMLHALLASMFVYIPSQLINYADLPLKQHGWLYLPLLFISLLFAFPSIILAEKYRKMRGIFLSAVMGILLSFVLLALGAKIVWVLYLALALFFIAFNVMEALLPSWLSKIAPIQSKATAMGLNASCQFLGGACGGLLGGKLLSMHNTTMGWGILVVLSVVWLFVVLGLNQPRYLSTLVVRVEQVSANLVERLLAIQGVEEVIQMSDDDVLYLKVERQQVDEQGREQLQQLLGQTLKI